MEEHEFSYTQYIIVNSDLKEMKKGKSMAQACHASLGAYLKSLDYKVNEEWLLEGGRKIVLKASEKEMMDLYQLIHNENINLVNKIPVHLVYDMGLTQLEPNSFTAVGLGPYDINILKEYVKDLKLV